MSESNDLNQTTLDYYFGWMQNNPTWKPEHTIIYAMWAEIERLRRETLVQSEYIETLCGLLRETLEDGHIRVPYGASHEDVSAIRDFEKRIKEAI